MRSIVWTGAEFKFDEKLFLNKLLHCQKDDEIYERALELVEEAKPYLKPAFAIKEVEIQEVKHEGIVIDGCFFNSKIIANRLKAQKNIFVFISTCGREINERLDSTDDALDKFLLDQIAYAAYLQAMNELYAQSADALNIGHQILLCPGSVIDWSIADVKKIFVLMEGLYQKIDVNVMESGLINPLKSGSGFFYDSNEEFESCAICPRPNCPSRIKEFDSDLHDQMTNL